MDPHDQEKAFDKLLARGLRQSQAAAGADCPAPEVLAAYFDRSLGEADRTRCESHLSTCGRCQQVLAVLVQSEVEAVPAGEAHPLERAAAIAASRIGQPIGAARAAQPRREVSTGEKKEMPRAILSPPARGRRWRSWRWLAPAAAVAAAIALWVAIRPTLPFGTSRSTLGRSEMASKRATPESPVEERKEVAENVQPPAPAAQDLNPAPQAGEMLKHSAGDQPTLRASEAEGLRAGSGERAAKRKSLEAVEPPKPLSPRDQTSAAAAAPAPAPSGKLAASDEKAQADLAFTQQGATPQAAPPAGVAGGVAKEPASRPEEAGARGQTRLPESQTAQVSGATTRTVMRARAAASMRQFTITSSNRSVLWRVGPRGSIERSRDAGRTWESQVSNVKVDLLGGSAPSETVCWVVGRAGIILRTTDGIHWEKVASPAPVEFFAIRASDALHATAFATGSELYFTNDGGRTWVPSSEKR